MFTQEGATEVSFKLVFYVIISIFCHPVSCDIDIDIDLKFKMLIYKLAGFPLDKQFVLTFLSGCFSCTMEGGFRIYNVEPLSEKARVGE